MGWLFHRDQQPDAFESIEELEEIYRSDNPADPRGVDLYNQLLRQGWYMAKNEHGEWVWYLDEES